MLIFLFAWLKFIYYIFTIFIIIVCLDKVETNVHMLNVVYARHQTDKAYKPLPLQYFFCVGAPPGFLNSMNH